MKCPGEKAHRFQRWENLIPPAECPGPATQAEEGEKSRAVPGDSDF